MERIWPKYYEVALECMNNDLKLKQRKTLPVDRKLHLPDSVMDNWADFRLFDNYVESDMMIEAIRALKLKSVLELAKNENEKHDLLTWAREFVLDDDEQNIYNGILNKLKGTRWGLTENAQYKERAAASWWK